MVSGPSPTVAWNGRGWDADAVERYLAAILRVLRLGVTAGGEYRQPGNFEPSSPPVIDFAGSSGLPDFRGRASLSRLNPLCFAPRFSP